MAQSSDYNFSSKGYNTNSAAAGGHAANMQIKQQRALSGKRVAAMYSSCQPQGQNKEINESQVSQSQTGTKRVKNHMMLEQEILSQFSQLIRVRMQSSRHLNLSIPPVVEGKEHRSYLQIRMDYAFLGSGRTSFKIDKSLLRQIVAENFSGSDACGLLEMEANYASTPKHFTVAILKRQLDQAQNLQDQGIQGLGSDQILSASMTYKEDNSSQCRHSCKFQLIHSQDQMQRNDLFHLCLNLVKKIQNVNCQDKFYSLKTQETEASASIDLKDQANNKLKFDASTMNISPLDFSRVLIRIDTSSDHEEPTINFVLLAPNTNFKIRAIPQMKLVSTPLSRLLLGKTTNESFNLPASGFLTLDSVERVIPLMPQDPFLQETPAVGIWIWNVDDLRSPYVWSVCTRFVFCRNFQPQSGKMPTQKANQFLMVNFKKNMPVQFLMLQVETDDQWVLYSDHQRLMSDQINDFMGLADQSAKPRNGSECFMNFSGIRVDSTITVQQFLEGGALQSSHRNQIGESVDSKKYATETHQNKKSINSRQNSGKQEHGRPAAQSLTAEYNSRYSRNKEEKKNSNAVQQQQAKPVSPNQQSQSQVSNQPNPSQTSTARQQSQHQQTPWQGLKIQTQTDLNPMREINFGNEKEEEKTNILRSNLRSNTPVSANTTRSRNSQSQNRNNKAQQQQQNANQQQNAQQPSSSFPSSAITNLSESAQGAAASSVVYFRHMGVEREANASPRTKQAMAIQQAEIARLNQEVANLRAQLQQAKSAQVQSQSRQVARGGEYTSESLQSQHAVVTTSDSGRIEAELPNQETAQFAPSLQQSSSGDKDSYQQKLELGQLETLKAFYQMNQGYHSQHQPRANQISSNSSPVIPQQNPATHASADQTNNKQQKQQARQQQQQLPVVTQADAAFFSQQVKSCSNRVGALVVQDGSPILQQSQHDTSSAIITKINQRRSNLPANLSPKDLTSGNVATTPSQGNNNRSRNLRKQTNNQKVAGGQGGAQAQLPYPRNQILYKSWSEQTLTSTAKARKDKSSNVVNVDGIMIGVGESRAEGNPVSANCGPMVSGKQQSRNTNLINIADNLEDQLMMPTLHKRSFSSSHIGMGLAGKSNSLNNSNKAEELAELMNRANVGSKASRNVLNDVNRKQDIHEQIELGKFINLIEKEQTTQKQTTADLDRMVAVHTRNAKHRQKHPKNDKSPSNNLEKPEKLDPFENTKSDEKSVDSEDDDNGGLNKDVVNNLPVRELSQSSNSENGDHTYNPYSFKRLQDAIFKKDAKPALKSAKLEKPGSLFDSESSANQQLDNKNDSRFLPLQRLAKQQTGTGQVPTWEQLKAKILQAIKRDEQQEVFETLLADVRNFMTELVRTGQFAAISVELQEDAAVFFQRRNILSDTESRKALQKINNILKKQLVQNQTSNAQEQKVDVESKASKHENNLDLPLQMNTPKPLVFRGVLEQSPYLMKYSKGYNTVGEPNQMSNSAEEADQHTLDSKLTFQHNQIQSHQKMFHPGPQTATNSQQDYVGMGGTQKFKDLESAQNVLKLQFQTSEIHQAIESEQGNSSVQQNIASDRYPNMFLEQHSQHVLGSGIANPNYSQDFGDAQSASQDSSGEAFGLHGTFQRATGGGSNAMRDQSAAAIVINKKSDWTMDMPKIDYQPDEDDDDDQSSQNDNTGQLEQLDQNEFLSDDSGDAQQLNNTLKDPTSN